MWKSKFSVLGFQCFDSCIIFHGPDVWSIDICLFYHRRGRVAASGGQVRRLCLADGVEVKLCILHSDDKSL
jgi:hypothetical protein